MENFRLVLIVSLAAVLLLIYQAWVHDTGQVSKGPAVTLSESQTTPTGAHTPQIPVVPTDSAPGRIGVRSPGAQVGPTGGQVITVETDVLRAEISLRGGTISSAWLLDYPVSPEDQTDKVRLLKPEPPNFFVAESGLIPIGTSADALPGYDAVFSSESRDYRLGADQSTLPVELTWTNDAGIKVRKSLLFKRGSYLVETSQEVVNATDKPLVAREYTQLQRTEYQDPNASRFISTYTGGVYYSPVDKYKKVPFANFKDSKDAQGQKLYGQVSDGWIAMIQHYFLAAWIPPRGVEESFYTNVLDGNRYVIGQFSPAVTIAPGATQAFPNQLFLGPKLPDALDKIAPGLGLTVDYGWLTVIAQPIHWLLDQIYGVVGNWGWSIIVLTILIKLAFYKLSETSYKSMANMRQLTPRMAALKDRYGDDKERLNQAMMELYKTEKINPLGGCLPIVVQIPVFIALYWVLLESVELRQAPFILWIDNLSAPDPYYVLPLIMGVSMFVQSKLNPAPPDPMQAKIMMSLPFIFTVFFAFFPSGLVLYWTVNNVLSIAQQWHITRNLEKETAKRKR
ncbi:membrane protein insertase YidC [uncultured Thiodictyon sp.]|jgi:YidC/Oxa1 family membrane protein insertase|uniref:membrane protein insertase YidC n=1 Tax=uncultured Thiodictyon sp. TaxID=1846217 RepID=UPI0025D164EA|nr:membrane protein insertase YidC [uncultured Thiodictyon sp.]